MHNKSIIAIDIDDVLAANAEGFVKFSNERWGTHLTVDDYDEHWAKVWQVEEEEVKRRAIELHESGTIGRYEKIPDADSILSKLHENHTIIAVTSRRIMVEPETRAWLDRHFTDIIDEVRFAGFYDDLEKTQQGRHATKADIIQQIGAGYFIDDQLKHCLAVAGNGTRVILFGNYSWNQIDTLPDGIVRCPTWFDVESYFQDKLV